jgi:hypothetical protein
MLNGLLVPGRNADHLITKFIPALISAKKVFNLYIT